MSIDGYAGGPGHGGNDLLAAYGDATASRRAVRTVVDNGLTLKWTPSAQQCT